MGSVLLPNSDVVKNRSKQNGGGEDSLHCPVRIHLHMITLQVERGVVQQGSCSTGKARQSDRHVADVSATYCTMPEVYGVIVQ